MFLPKLSETLSTITLPTSHCLVSNPISMALIKALKMIRGPRGASLNY
ncbi:hypothetical protein LEP1GSC051_1094, partial [Leptospira sp. P2653]